MSFITSGKIMRRGLAGRIAHIVTLPFALFGCSGPEFLSLAVSRAGITVHEDLAYGSDPRQKLDLYVHKRLDGKARLLVFSYGGGWDDGSKAGYLFAIRPFLDAGYIVALPDYRVYPQAHFPDFVDDGAAAVRWLSDNAGQYGADTSRLYLAGHSAGAYNAVMLALDPRYLQAVGLERRRIAAVIGLAGRTTSCPSPAPITPTSSPMAATSRPRSPSPSPTPARRRSSSQPAMPTPRSIRATASAWPSGSSSRVTKSS
jgi:pimeloyl-ACP methyl ester carboxylesterase